MTEPYAWLDIDSQLRSKQTSLRDIPLYTKQEWQNVEIIKPEWQGLTFADIDDIGVSKDWIAGARWAEAKLKDKNTSDDARMKAGWQGLTDDELREMLGYGKGGYIPDYTKNFVDAIEAKLKDKNT